MSEASADESNELKFTLLENALDSISMALEFLANEDRNRLKVTVLLLGQGVELVLKARLEQEHWSLIFDDPRNAGLNKFEKGDFKSVGFAVSEAAGGDLRYRIPEEALRGAQTAARYEKPDRALQGGCLLRGG
jgi:hypothetical protein